MTVPELKALGYKVTEAERVYCIEAEGVCIFTTADALPALLMPDTAVVAAEQAVLAATPKRAVKDPLASIGALDPATATVADIIAAAKQ